MTDGLSAADVMALSRDDENNWMNNPFIYLVWMWMFGANGWNRNNDASMQGALTRSDLFEGFNNQDVNSQLRGITNGVCDGFYATNNSLKDGFFSVQSALAPNRIAAVRSAAMWIASEQRITKTHAKSRLRFTMRAR